MYAVFLSGITSPFFFFLFMPINMINVCHFFSPQLIFHVESGKSIKCLAGEVAEKDIL